MILSSTLEEVTTENLEKKNIIETEAEKVETKVTMEDKTEVNPEEVRIIMREEVEVETTDTKTTEIISGEIKEKNTTTENEATRVKDMEEDLEIETEMNLEQENRDTEIVPARDHSEANPKVSKVILLSRAEKN